MKHETPIDFPAAPGHYRCRDSRRYRLGKGWRRVTHIANTDEIRATVARLRKLLAEATPGPWMFDESRHHAQNQVVASSDITAMEHGRTIATAHYTAWRPDGCRDARPNARLMAEGLTALPTLLLAIEALLAENERLTASLHEHGEHIPSCPSRGDVPEHPDCDCGLARALKGFGVGC